MIVSALVAAALQIVPVAASGATVKPCHQRIDPPGPNPGYQFKTSIYDCRYVLVDGDNSRRPVQVQFEFKLSGLAPVPEDLRNYMLPALTLTGPVASYHEPRFEGPAQFVLMPAWLDKAAQDRAQYGYEWPLAPDSTKGVKCQLHADPGEPDRMCRAIVRDSKDLVVHAVFFRGTAPLDRTYDALAIFATNW